MTTSTTVIAGIFVFSGLGSSIPFIQNITHHACLHLIIVHRQQHPDQPWVKHVNLQTGGIAPSTILFPTLKGILRANYLKWSLIFVVGFLKILSIFLTRWLTGAFSFFNFFFFLFASRASRTACASLSLRRRRVMLRRNASYSRKDTWHSRKENGRQKNNAQEL